MQSWKQITMDCLLSGFIAGIVCAYGNRLVIIYGSDLADMTSKGKWLFVLPLLLSPVEFLLAYRLIKIVRTKASVSVFSKYIFALLAIAFVPSIVISALNRYALEAIEIPRQSLDFAAMQKLQSMQLSESAFPFVVRFHWHENSVRVVFERTEGRVQIVQDTLSTALHGMNVGN